MKSDRRNLAEPSLAAGGIVLQSGTAPQVAIVRLRKRNQWVLPKGKLDAGETPRQAAEREVLEETGHRVLVHEFIGTLAYNTGGRSKVVHFWRMEATAEPTLPLMDDVKEVAWLPLEVACERLSRGHEQAFLTHVGPLALQAVADAVNDHDGPRREPPAPLSPAPPLTAVQRLWRWLGGG